MRPLSCPVSLFCDNNFHQKKLSHKFSIYFGDWSTFCCCSCYCLSRISLLDKTENWRQGNLCISVLVNFCVWIYSLLKLFNLQAFYSNKYGSCLSEELLAILWADWLFWLYNPLEKMSAALCAQWNAWLVRSIHTRPKPVVKRWSERVLPWRPAFF